MPTTATTNTTATMTF